MTVVARPAVTGVARVVVSWAQARVHVLGVMALLSGREKQNGVCAVDAVMLDQVAVHAGWAAVQVVAAWSGRATDSA